MRIICGKGVAKIWTPHSSNTTVQKLVLSVVLTQTAKGGF